MRRCNVLVIILTMLVLGDPHRASFAQTSDEQPAAPPVSETSASSLNADPDPVQLPPQQEEQPRAESTGQERTDAIAELNELRGAVRTFPSDAAARLQLAQRLYRVGDLDAALDECRIALKLQPANPEALLQLGIILMAKQHGHAAATALMEAILLNPELTHAHYSLGSVQYSLGNLKAAAQSYRRALELQPYFPDARYRLALVLKLTNRDQEAAQFMEEAAVGGVPQAQFFAGNAYKSGQGVAKHLGQAVFWWARAVEFGHQQAADALAKLRRQALSADQTDRRRNEALDGFRAYRALLWEAFPDYNRSEASESLGAVLLKDNRTDLAVPTLLQEAYALSDAALAELAGLYEAGWDGHLPPFDKKMFSCIETLAAEGFAPAKKVLARIYGLGIGTAPDRVKAKASLKGLPKPDAHALIDELGLR